MAWFKGKAWSRWYAPKPPQPLPDGPILGAEPEAMLDVIARGAAAQRLLNDPVLKAALDEIEKTAIEMWRASKPSEDDRREELFRTVKAIDLLRSKLQAYRDTGRVKRVELEAAEKAA